MQNQKILCDVKVCKHNDCQGSCCSLAAITVTPEKDCKTAHYCKDYVQK